MLRKNVRAEPKMSGQFLRCYDIVCGADDKAEGYRLLIAGASETLSAIARMHAPNEMTRRDCFCRYTNHLAHALKKETD